MWKGTLNGTKAKKQQGTMTSKKNGKSAIVCLILEQWTEW